MNNNTVYSQIAAEQANAAVPADRLNHPATLTVDYADFRIALGNIQAAFQLLCDFDEETLWSPVMIEAMKKSPMIDQTVQRGRSSFIGCFYALAEARDTLLECSGLKLDEIMRPF